MFALLTRIHIATVGVSGSQSGLSDHDLVQADARVGDLEDGGVRPSAGRRSEEAVAGCILRVSLCVRSSMNEQLVDIRCH